MTKNINNSCSMGLLRKLLLRLIEIETFCFHQLLDCFVLDCLFMKKNTNNVICPVYSSSGNFNSCACLEKVLQKLQT